MTKEAKLKCQAECSAACYPQVYPLDKIEYAYTFGKEDLLLNV